MIWGSKNYSKWLLAIDFTLEKTFMQFSNFCIDLSGHTGANWVDVNKNCDMIVSILPEWR